MKILLKTTAVLVLLLFWSGCAKMNSQDPEPVARTAWKAIMEKDIETLESLIIPRERESFNGNDFAEELKRLPPFPENIVVRIERKGGGQAEAFLENWEFEEGLNMEKEAGRWWIVQ